MTGTTFVIGFMGIPNPATHPNIGYGIDTVLLIEYFAFFIAIGPIIYTTVTEIPSNYPRRKSAVLAPCSLQRGRAGLRPACAAYDADGFLELGC